MIGSQPDEKAPAQTHRETQRDDYQASYMPMVYSWTRQRAMYVAFSNNFIGYKLMHVEYIYATAAKSLICSAETGEGEAHIFFII